MEKIREVIAYKNYFEDFLKEQPIKVQDKIFKIIEASETLERVPVNYLKAMEGTEGLLKQGFNLPQIFGECFVSLIKEGSSYY